MDKRFIREPIADRFWSKVARSDGCWLWMAQLTPKGYGNFTEQVRGKTVNRRAHRFAYELQNGAVADGLVVCHKCDNPRCVRPDHLFVATQAGNLADASRKGRLGKKLRERFRSRTHCVRGHPFSAQNTNVTPTGRLACRECQRVKNKIAFDRRKAAAA